MKNLSAKNNEEKNDFSASLRPFGTHNSHYLFASHIARSSQHQMSGKRYTQFKKYFSNGE